MPALQRARMPHLRRGWGYRPHKHSYRLIYRLGSVRDLPKQIVFGPCEVGHFHDRSIVCPVHDHRLPCRPSQYRAGRRLWNALMGRSAAARAPRRREHPMVCSAVPTNARAPTGPSS